MFYGSTHVFRKFLKESFCFLFSQWPHDILNLSNLQSVYNSIYGLGDAIFWFIVACLLGVDGGRVSWFCLILWLVVVLIAGGQIWCLGRVGTRSWTTDRHLTSIAWNKTFYFTRLRWKEDRGWRWNDVTKLNLKTSALNVTVEPPWTPVKNTTIAAAWIHCCSYCLVLHNTYSWPCSISREHLPSFLGPAWSLRQRPLPPSPQRIVMFNCKWSKTKLWM